MTIFVLLVTFTLIGLLITVAWLVFSRVTATKSGIIPIGHTSNVGGLSWKVYVCLILAGLIIIGSFWAPFLLTRKAINEDFNFSNTGQIGDTIGGLMNPFIAIAGVIVTGLAFYIQYKANEQQRALFLAEQDENKAQLQLQIDVQNRQNELAQFESQFYEMLKLHRENISEMDVSGYDFNEVGSTLVRFEKTTSGRKIFVTMQKELECIFGIYKLVSGTLTKDGLDHSYQIFFEGLDEFSKKHPEQKLFVDKLNEARRRHRYPDDSITTNQSRKDFGNDIKMNFNFKPFSGHASRLGHYFRHLYLAVKSIATSDIVTDYDDRMKYLKLLRAQLSNHEQILLFYNWLAGYGTDWENNEQPFFTEYKMIHNLWYDRLPKDEIIQQNVNFLRTKNVEHRQGKMFEID
ncbi:putative phage abortive infection protein [Mucilaginibacter pedocola]|uniref:Phage abortive infection protein n=1 Tax=Mucilaginibacter pedocola TaxID=1792845 RepID=A0A1S9PMV2_9SPHI|nr:putative phage abortive infection protein [Mucilaginibacter pedocola]OOQ61918.1 hypothetical protein BC343_02325 [Mucilaginibacter pedocola]